MNVTGTIGGSMAPKSKVDTSRYSGRLAERLTSLRVAAGLSVDEFARAITKAGYSVKEPTIYSWEQGRSSPHVEAFPAIAKVLKIAPGDVLPKR
jgi:transcriptional regulator with XRE-family HTH domain